MTSAHTGPVVLPVLPCTTIGAGIEFYQRLGLTVETIDLQYALVTNGSEELFHLRAVRDLDTDTNPTMAFVHVDDPDEWQARVTARGIAATPPIDELWGVREFRFRDTSGNTLRIGRAIS